MVPDDTKWRIVTLCALIAEARAIADVTDTLLAAHLSLAESRALDLRAELLDVRRPNTDTERPPD